MIKIRLLLLFSIISINSFSQIPILKDEKFDDNELNWHVERENHAITEILNGYYYIYQKTSDLYYYCWNNLKYENSTDFIVESKIRQVYGETNFEYGIIFCSNINLSSKLLFMVTSDKNYKVEYQKGDSNIVLVDWKYSTHIKPKGNYNTFKVSKTDNKLSFFINDSYLCSTELNDIYLGNDFGFMLYSKNKIQIDYLKINAEKPKINLVDNIISAEKENLGVEVNSEASELAPIISPDGNTLYFTRQKHTDNATKKSSSNIWYSIYENDKWTKAKNIGQPLNNTSSNFTIAASTDNNSLVVNGKYSAFGEIIGNGISISKRIDNTKWSLPKTIEITNFHNDRKSQSLSFSADLNIILMAIKTDKSVGGADLYVSFKNKQGVFSEPMNIGTDINTINDEITPFLAADKKTLYFSSNGHNGYGSSDIFVSKRLDDSWTKWSKPLNLGPFINTENWDAYFTIDASGEYSYFVSTDDSHGNEDIFRIKLQEELKPEPVVIIYGDVYNAKTHNKISADIIISDNYTNKVVSVLNYSYNVGQFKVVLNYGREYKITVNKEGYLVYSKTLNLIDTLDYSEKKKDIFLNPLQTNKITTLSKIQFSKGTYTLSQSSYVELNELANTLKQNPNLQIEIYGHTNNIGNYDLLMELSENRAKSVKQYLIAQGINEKRIRTRGFGPDKPIAPNNTTAGRIKNQRVEYKIIK